jgi:hypothetical protein
MTYADDVVASFYQKCDELEVATARPDHSGSYPECLK